MKEWTIRIGCILLGAVLMLGALTVKELIENGRCMEEAQNELDLSEQEQEVQENNTEAVIEQHGTESQEPEQNYKLEAELKFRDLIDNKIPELVEGNAQESEETTEYPINSIEAAPVKWIKDYPKVNSDSSLEEKAAIRSSYDETMAVNAFDKMVIENSTIDFSDVKISIMGDSITAGNILPEDERGIYDWPSQLCKILGCKEVVNLGIGGSTVSCCVDNYPMCKRWWEISSDSDIIIVMGGSNDMLFESKWQFGNIDFDLRFNKETFCGDLDDMCSRMNWTYKEHNEETNSKLLFINPPSTILNDGVYFEDPENMVHQSSFAEAINVIAPSYNFEVIDLYNNNILNSHDIDVNRNFVPDGIHLNKEGCRILAEHVASQIIQRVEQ